ASSPAARALALRAESTDRGSAVPSQDQTLPLLPPRSTFSALLYPPLLRAPAPAAQTLPPRRRSAGPPLLPPPQSVSANPRDAPRSDPAPPAEHSDPTALAAGARVICDTHGLRLLPTAPRTTAAAAQ